MKKVMIWLLAVPTVLLMAMGFAFCWLTPANTQLHGDGSHYFFTQMACWTVVGLGLASCAYLVGWRRWLKVAPFIFLGWVGLVIYAATCPLVDGHWGYVGIGCIRIKVTEFVPVVLSLALANFARRFNLKAFVVVGMAFFAVVGAVGYRFYHWQNRNEQADLLPSQQIVAREAHQKAYEFLQNQNVGAIRESKWFGSSDINLRFLPESTTTSMPASASVLFGKWYLVLLTLAFGVMGVGIGVAWRAAGDEPMRTYALTWCGLALVPCFLNILWCVGCMPKLNCGIPFASYGGTLVMSTLIGLAILVSQCVESASGQVLSCRSWMQIAVPAAAVVLVTLWGIASVPARENFTYRGARDYHDNGGLHMVRQVKLG